LYGYSGIYSGYNGGGIPYLGSASDEVTNPIYY
jgi:hypothetical protein